MLLILITLLVFIADLKQFCHSEPVHFLREIPICSNNTDLFLSANGFDSSRVISLQPGMTDYCSIIIKAPPTHVIHLQIMEDHDRLHHMIHTSMQSPCGLHIFLGDINKSIWSGDICSTSPLSQVDLLSPFVILRWKSSYDILQTKGRKIVVTAIGKDDFCLEKGQHACMRIGLKPIFCISEELTCDGHPHCPQGSKSGDEDKVCDGDMGKLWQRKFIGLMNKLPPNVANTIKKDLENATELPIVLTDLEKTWTHFKKIATVEASTTQAPDLQYGSLENFLSQYGPWGYMCLVLVLCLSVLIMCGLWECCVRYKNDIWGLSRRQATTVVIVNGYEENANNYQQSLPPEYEDLDFPPSYNTLFPKFSANGEPARENIEMTSITNCSDRNNSATNDDDEQLSET